MIRILLDECVNRRLCREFSQFEVTHVSNVGFDTLKNGALLREANQSFDVLVTIDKNMPYQSSLKGLRIAVVVLDARSNSVTELRGFITALEEHVTSVTPGTFSWVRRDSP